jgi:hypothetical protein
MIWLRALLLVLTLAAAAPALEVREVRWGFDGHIVPQRFNLLSVLVAEPGTKAFEGELALLETRGLESTVGAPLVQPIFVAPGTQRWVQFLPFISGDFAWRLRWGQDRTQSHVLPAPAFGPPATVLLYDPADPAGQTVQMKAFPEELFPASAAATDGLDMLVLDYAPRWDAPRRAAFLDWLARGGVVHLLPHPGGGPVFSGELAVLNSPEPRARHGAGWIVRHATPRAGCSAETLAAAGFPLRELRKPDPARGLLYGLDQSLLRGLASLTRPQVQWWLLYLLTLGYLVLIGPVHYRWAQKVDYRLALGGFLGTVALFALLFIVAGRRGAGEQQAAHSVAVARALGGGRWDVTQWISAFATTGGTYRLTHAAEANFYSATHDQEAVAGQIAGGKDGHFTVDIPLYSARPFLHRAVLAGPEAKVAIAEWNDTALRVRVENPLAEGIEAAWVRRADRMLPLAAEGGGAWVWTDRQTPAQSLAEFFNPENRRGLMLPAFDEWQTFDPAQLQHPLLARELGDVPNLPHPISARALAPDEAQLFLFGKAPAALATQGRDFRPGQGWVLSVVPLFQPAAPPLERPRP